MSDEQPLYINTKHWLRRRSTDENIKVDKIIEACEPQLRPALETIRQQQYKVTTREQLARVRERTTESNAKSILDAYHARYPGSHLERVEWSFERQGHIIGLTIFRPPDDGTAGGRPCVYYIHGGGFIFGNRWSGIATIIHLIHDHNAICVTVEYRLAPEWNAPTSLEDCYHGLVQVWKQRESFGINDRLLLVGRSAGANLAAGVALRVRDSQDQGKPRICGQILSFPMLDHTSTMASEKFSESPAWPLCNNRFAWAQYLGDEEENVTIYTVPGIAAAQDLCDWPRTLVEYAHVDCLSTEAHHFGEKLEAAGNDVEIIPWEGLFHCGDWTLQGRQDLYHAELQSRSEWAGRCFRDS
ncbi:hypothetical protein UA08_09437 [Talaromyces atroroseus]|uniref:Alpha/beta hydrolase fold-3 domain-containing protein n=1 Tax=Talaromyces atroroseus TaxID=1441469 RepID=A0A225AK94_TALAT|nr:hypothetical protein UA08_09437 [Talaromyces atroroseus]OKL55286.1 hypothetical protein UA08_09437 [Talaromyces atroroseus]